MTGVPRFVQQSLGRGLCPSGKHAYEHRSDAKAELGRARNSDHSHHRMSVYRCEACGFFHIGHVPAVKARGDELLWQRIVRQRLAQLDP